MDSGYAASYEDIRQRLLRYIDTLDAESGNDLSEHLLNRVVEELIGG